MRSEKPRDLCQRTFEFACDVIDLCLPLSRKGGIKGLIAATSVGSNAEEATAANSRREFACKNSTVLKEAAKRRTV